MTTTAQYKLDVADIEAALDSATADMHTKTDSARSKALFAALDNLPPSFPYRAQMTLRPMTADEYAKFAEGMQGEIARMIVEQNYLAAHFMKAVAERVSARFHNGHA